MGYSARSFRGRKGVSRTALAAHLKCKPGRINEIIKGKRGVTPGMALALAEAFGTSSEFWVHLQSDYDLWQAMQDHERVGKLA